MSQTMDEQISSTTRQIFSSPQQFLLALKPYYKLGRKSNIKTSCNMIEYKPGRE